MQSILVIDNDKNELKSYETALEFYGFNVEGADNVAEGIQKFQQGEFDLVITNVLMPVMDGNGVANHIREISDKPLPIIAISGNDVTHNEKNFDLVIYKPFSAIELTNRVSSFLSFIKK